VLSFSEQAQESWAPEIPACVIRASILLTNTLCLSHCANPVYYFSSPSPPCVHQFCVFHCVLFLFHYFSSYHSSLLPLVSSSTPTLGNIFCICLYVYLIMHVFVLDYWFWPLFLLCLQLVLGLACSCFAELEMQYSVIYLRSLCVFNVGDHSTAFDVSHRFW
jgi:hypothetical protein